ncbi:hypothetical protein BKA70DRAFT_1446627 [Coprinopsis sp. MPI-PUGE-AT-0042]|nr:hypothetical protein BKA70DRAFT_1446627 [Coprinopsis sp. MPI-PUGE-AT-0042]
MFSSLVRYGIEGVPRSSGSPAHGKPTVNAGSVPGPSPRTQFESTPGDNTLVLPHPKTWTETPPQSQPLPVLEFRMELLEDRTCRCRRKTVARPPCREDNADPPNAESGSADYTVLLNLRTLGLDSVLPHDSPDFTIAAVKLGRASRARAEALEQIDRAVEDLRVLIDLFNNANDNIALSASLYEAVRHYHSRPKISRVMADLVNALHPIDPKASQA